MKPRFFLFIGLCCSLTSLMAQNKDYSKAVFEKNGLRLPYRILLPENYNPKQKYPLLLFLHGAGERGEDNVAQLTHGSDQFLSNGFRQSFPAIVVFPQCPTGDYWASVTSREGPLKFVYPKKPKDNPLLDLVEDLLKDLAKTYSLDRRRLYVGGLSMGGMGTFELVYRNPRTFAAAFAICGGANPKIARRIRRPAWRIDHGDADTVVPYALSQQMVLALEQKKATILFNRYAGVGHDSWDNVFADASFLPWLFSQRK